MSNYNTFVVVDCNTKKTILTTSSARKAYALLEIGKRIDVWNNNRKVETIHARGNQRNRFARYIELEKDYIRKKQRMATVRNTLRGFE